MAVCVCPPGRGPRSTGTVPCYVPCLLCCQDLLLSLSRYGYCKLWRWVTFTFTCPPSTSNAVHNFSLVTTTKCHWWITLTLTLSLLQVHHHALMQFIQLRCRTLIIFCMHTIQLYFGLDLHCTDSWCQAGIRRVFRSCHRRTDGTTRFHLQSWF